MSAQQKSQVETARERQNILITIKIVHIAATVEYDPDRHHLLRWTGNSQFIMTNGSNILIRQWFDLVSYRACATEGRDKARIRGIGVLRQRTPKSLPISPIILAAGKETLDG